jgi:hypothetical protein
MSSLQECLEQTDELAQDVVNAWGINFSAGNAKYFSTDFRVLFEKTCLYRDAKQLADNHRKFNALSEPEAERETATREAFCKEYKDFSEKKANE